MKIREYRVIAGGFGGGHAESRVIESDEHFEDTDVVPEETPVSDWQKVGHE